MVEVKNFKSEIFLAIKAEKPGEGVLRPNGRLDIKAKKLREGVLRPNGKLAIKAENLLGTKFY